MATPSQRTLFAGDTHASHSVPPGSDKARKMTAISGRKCVELLQASGRDGLLPRTLLGTSAWASTKCWLTWKPRTTPGGRLLSQLAPSMPTTEETEFGLLPTPVTMYTRENWTLEDIQRRQAEVKAETNSKGKHHTGNGFGMNLAQVARLLPTPTANEDAAGTPNGKMQRQLGNHPDIRGTTPEEWASGTLNPAWVEWLMGFPVGWTELEPSETP